MDKSALDQWLDLAPKPWPLRPDQKWHTYVSYRSIHRAWVLQLYDILKDLHYQAFLDQYVLTAGTSLVRSLQEALENSASAILVWGSGTDDSAWIQREYKVFETLAHDNADFKFVIVTLDRSSLPRFAFDRMFVDFSEFREGPNGTPLLQLLYAINGQPLPSEAIELAARVDAETRDSLALIRAARSVGQKERLLELTHSNTLAWQTSPSLLCQVIEALISLREIESALRVVEQCRSAFPQAIRPQQLQALALAQRGDWQEAQLILTKLYESGERDAETLGILGRTWMDRYRTDKNLFFLRRSRDLYLEAFRAAPDDFYTGINAASKSAMLGELTEASDYARKVEALVGDTPSLGDYWKTATSAEVKLLQRDFAGAGQLYQAAVSVDPLALGSHESTYHQASLLLDHLKASPEQRSLVLSAFAHVSHSEVTQEAPTYQPQPADRVIAAKLLFNLVARRHAEPGLIMSLDPVKFWEAVRKVRPAATRADLPALADELGGAEGGSPSKLWLAWLEIVHFRDLDKLLQ